MVSLGFLTSTMLRANAISVLRNHSTSNHCRRKSRVHHDRTSNTRTCESKKTISHAITNKLMHRHRQAVNQNHLHALFRRAAYLAFNAIRYHRSTLLRHAHKRNFAYDVEWRHVAFISPRFSLKPQYCATLTLQHY